MNRPAPAAVTERSGTAMRALAAVAMDDNLNGEDVRAGRSAAHIDPVPLVKSGSAGLPSSRPKRWSACSWMFTWSLGGANT